MRLSGFLYLLILVLYFAMGAFGYLTEIGDFNLSDAVLKKFNDHPKKFKIGIVLALIAHSSVVTLPIMLFIAFSQYNLILGIVWITSRIGEGLIQFYNEKDYWGLLNMARQFSVTSGAEKKSLSDSARTILNKKEYRFKLTQFLWGLGTIAFSIVLAYEVALPFIGWLGIVAGILSVLYNRIILLKLNSEKPVFKVLAAIGGLSGIIFEIIIGGRLLFYTHLFPKLIHYDSP